MLFRSDIEHREPHRAADRRVSLITGTERIVSAVHANLFRERAVDDDHRRAGMRGRVDAVEIEAFIDAEGVTLPDPKEGYIDIGLVTIPVGCPVIATECRTIKQNGGSFKDFAKSLTHSIEYLQPQVVLIYGGEEHQSKFRGYLPEESDTLRYIMLRSYMAERRGWLEKKSRKKKRG